MAEKAIVSDYGWLVEGPAPQRKTRKKVVSAERTSKFDPAVEVLTEVECFQLFLSEETFYNILTFSNKKIAKKHKIKDKLLPKHIYRFVGILIYMGAHHDTKNPIEELWSMEDGKAIYRTAMSRNMFKFITANIETYDVDAPGAVEVPQPPPDDKNKDDEDANCVEGAASEEGDDEEEDENREYLNSLEFDDEKFRILSKKQLKKSVRVKRGIDLKENYLKYYTPSNFVSVDKHLCSFKGKMWAKVFIKSKPGRYGIKFRMSADSETGMALNLQMYCGKCGGREENQGFRVTRDMVLPMLCRRFKTTVVCDNFFCTLKLSHYLAAFGCQLLGTMRMNRKEVPAEAKDVKKRSSDTTIFFSKGKSKLVSYYNEKKKLVLLLTTCHDKDDIVAVETTVYSGGKQQVVHKPQPIIDYNHKMGGVDTADQMVRYYSCRRKTYRWNIRVLYDMIDIAALNGYKTYSAFNKGDRIEYRNKLSRDLMAYN
ncbi:hypothetical protein EIN_094410 [Entamoeba invadens IP1]|uniref:PiggyBac transposable element-derived protein domain-containing protein n=1 Tax=Entamoeba invadens IP1 TaxID=370355 RepID=A0A0A1U031_ENTIV|nr:hypothetical protein EIN_094410 [Entamoeba invadens IP1]ELP87234.1 hypothetical protein EIN_094410 [Entamoeba invadens IP1]|eukprot:XP_004254005.1 hypothetical protein EIN_094410 [Entamoeba invadens IP1]